MKDFDCVVIGGGILGCFTARELCRYQLSVALLERHSDVCTGISKANTAIVYSGYDTKTGTRKMQLCCQGNRCFDRLCHELDVPFRRTGSLMVCFGKQGEAVVRHKYRNGQANGVPGLCLLSRAEALELEPQLNPAVRLALWAPTTGTVNPYQLTIAAYENALTNGCAAFMNTEVKAIEHTAAGYLVSTNGGQFRCRAVVNAAGLFADSIHDLAAPPQARICPQKADYYLLDDKSAGYIRHIIFHEPEDGGKGLTLVPSVEGNLLIGPSEQGDAAKDDYATTGEGLAFLHNWCRKVVPGLPLQQIIRNFASLRPLLYALKADAAGNLCLGQQISGFELSQTMEQPAFISFLGIKTPGMTCAEGLAQQAAAAIACALGNTALNAKFNPCRRAIPSLAQLSIQERSGLISRNPAYGQIVCRCRGISEGEIIDAIRRGATTVNGLKRRVGVCSGRCQGSYCLRRVTELLARETGRPITAVAWDEPGSEVFQGVSDD